MTEAAAPSLLRDATIDLVRRLHGVPRQKVGVDSGTNVKPLDQHHLYAERWGIRFVLGRVFLSLSPTFGCKERRKLVVAVAALFCLYSSVALECLQPSGCRGSRWGPWCTPGLCLHLTLSLLGLWMGGRWDGP